MDCGSQSVGMYPGFLGIKGCLYPLQLDDVTEMHRSMTLTIRFNCAKIFQLYKGGVYQESSKLLSGEF